MLTRVLLYTGKGGVGKTTLSAATAVLASRRGCKTLVISTDAAHSLADALEVEIGEQRREIAPNLFAEEISVHRELEVHWDRIQDYVRRLLTSQGYDDLVAEELAIMPGMEELFSLLKLGDYLDDKEFDLIVIDSAPTGAALKLLSFTDIIQWYMERFFDLNRKVVKTIKPIAERVIKAPMPGDDVYDQAYQMYKRMLNIKNYLADPRYSSIRIVCNPEKMVVKESQRAYTYLSLFGFPVDLLIVNRVLSTDNGEYGSWPEIQAKYLKQIRSSFNPLPILEVPLYDRETLGIQRLTQLGTDLFGERNPDEIFHTMRPLRIESRNGTAELRIHMPHVEKDQIDLWVKQNELIITVMDYQRNFLLPDTLVGRRVKRARMVGDDFVVSFGRA